MAKRPGRALPDPHRAARLHLPETPGSQADSPTESALPQKLDDLPDRGRGVERRVVCAGERAESRLGHDGLKTVDGTGECKGVTTTRRRQMIAHPVLSINVRLLTPGTCTMVMPHRWSVVRERARDVIAQRVSAPGQDSHPESQANAIGRPGHPGRLVPAPPGRVRVPGSPRHGGISGS